MKRGLFMAVLLLAAGGVFTRFCSGPDPQVILARMRPHGAEATVRNQGFGEGDVSVRFTVRGASGPPIVKDEKVELMPRQEARVETRIEGARGDEQVSVDVEYPPR